MSVPSNGLLSLTQSLRIKLEQCSRCQKQASSVSTQLIIADVSRQKREKKIVGLAWMFCKFADFGRAVYEWLDLP